MYKVSLTGASEPVIFGDLSDRVGVMTFFEGLLHFAFSPTFEDDGFVYVYYTRGTPEPAILSRFSVKDGAMDMASEDVIFEVEAPTGNHYGGSIEFDSEGLLYLAIGYGGVFGSAQDTSNALGTVIRLDVSTSPPMAADGNPFIGEEGLDEIFAFGFRNPWRMSIDRETDEIWLGDVGEVSWEEINRVESGLNYGWDDTEGYECFVAGCDPTLSTPPYYVYAHSLIGDTTSITGGHVYRGEALPELDGWYIYSDFFQGDIFAINTDVSPNPILLVATDLLVVSFAVLPDGETAYVGFDGSVHQIVRAENGE